MHQTEELQSEKEIYAYIAVVNKQMKMKYIRIKIKYRKKWVDFPQVRVRHNPLFQISTTTPPILSAGKAENVLPIYPPVLQRSMSHL